MIPGLKVSARDVSALTSRPWPVAVRLLEIHLAPKDAADRSLPDAFAGLADRYLLAVHQPFQLPDGRIPDLASGDAGLRRASMRMLEAAASFGAAIEASFLIAHPGGARRRGEPDPDAALLARSLGELETEIPLLLENMPFWYGFPDGEMGRCALGRTPEELLAVDELVAGWCLDVSHAWGARAPGSVENVRAFLPHAGRILHVHAAGAGAPDREGLPLEEGEVGPEEFRGLARALGPRVAAVPEIRDAHLDPARTARALAWLSAAGAFPDQAR